MNWKEQYKSFLWIAGFFLFAYFMPVQRTDFQEAVYSAFGLLKWYAKEHVLLCLIPAFFIAGVIAVFISQAAVIKYFGSGAKKWISYSVASVSGAILAVCSCTILPLFSGIYKRGAGLGPAIAFLYSGPAINILAIILTARILGLEMGVARTIGAVAFSIVIGLIMHFIYRREDAAKAHAQIAMNSTDESRPLWQTSFHFFSLVFILVFLNWGKPDSESGIWYVLYHQKWMIASVFGLILAGSLLFILKLSKLPVVISAAAVIITAIVWQENPLIPFIIAIIAISVILSMDKGAGNEWMGESWGFAKQILPLLAAGVLISGFLLGAPDGGQGIIPNRWIAALVGGNSVFANFFASVVAAFMYFATLTEVPILQGLMKAGMGKGPALALLLAGPALSLPNMLVIRGVIGTQKTIVYVSLVIIMATFSGIIYGSLS
jgi:uncharacterized membrane protein YraQ (UPF0718 family)